MSEQDFGPTFPQHLDGEFALALVDRRPGWQSRLLEVRGESDSLPSSCLRTCSNLEGFSTI